MPDWNDIQPLVRFDDPYHAWAYLADDAAGMRNADALCPVVIEIFPEQETYASLETALRRFKKDYLGAEAIEIPLAGETTTNAPFVVTGYDAAHFESSLSWIASGTAAKTKNDDFLDKTAYLRLYLVYAREDTLFDPENKLWNNPLFGILFAGRAVRNRATREDVSPGSNNDRSTAQVEMTIIDDSIAFLNEAFYLQPASTPAETRFRNIWFQDRERFVEGQLYEGARLSAKHINELLAEVGTHTEASLYAREIQTFLDDVKFRPLDPFSEEHQPLAFKVSHGTHVASTALSAFDESIADQGIDREVDFNAITVPAFATQDTSGSTVASYIIAAIRQAMLWNDERYEGQGSAHTASRPKVPLFINCSYGFTAGPKDGTHSLNLVLERLLDARNKLDRPTALVVPMGNSYEDKTVASTCKLAPGACVEVDWIVLPDDQTASFLELYARQVGAAVDAPGIADYRIDLSPPETNLAPLEATAGETDEAMGAVLHDRDGLPLAFWSNWPRPKDSYWSRRGVIALAPTKTLEAGYGTIPSGRWRMRITNVSEAPIEVLAMIQRDDAPGTYPLISWQSYFEQTSQNEDALEITRERTASAMASCKSAYVFVVGAGAGTNADQQQLPVGASPYASKGPRLPEDLGGPDATALADRSNFFLGIYGAGTYSGTKVLMSGSSVAAPRLAGRLAANPKGITSREQFQEIESPGSMKTDLRFGKTVF